MSKPGRSFSSKKRNKQNRKEKPMIIITAEGKNETEAQYFDGFRTPDCHYIIKFHKAGHLTDPTKLAESIRKRWDKEEADVRTGDMAFVVVDLDNKEDKAKEIQKLEAKNRVRNEDRETWAEAWGDALTKLMDLAIKALGDSISVNMEKTRKSDIVR